MTGTEEVEAYHSSKDEVHRTNRQVLQIVVVSVTVIILIVLATGIFVSIRVNQIRTTQVMNTQVTQCQARALNTLLSDINYASAHPHQTLHLGKIQPC